jgi:hypothetical protein
VKRTATTAEVIKAIRDTGIEEWNVDIDGGCDVFKKPGAMPYSIEYEPGNSWANLRIEGKKLAAKDGRRTQEINVKLAAYVEDDAPIGVA